MTAAEAEISENADELIERARTGCREAFAELVRAHQRTVRLYLNRFVASRADADELAQTTDLGFPRMERVLGKAIVEVFECEFTAFRDGAGREDPFRSIGEAPHDLFTGMEMSFAVRGEMTADGVDKILQAGRARAGLERATCHQLRHTCLTRLREAGMELEAVQAQAGHASIESTRIYVHLTDDWLAGEYRRASERIDADAAAELVAMQEINR